VLQKFVEASCNSTKTSSGISSGLIGIVTGKGIENDRKVCRNSENAAGMEMEDDIRCLTC
jgi:hypothetical protein